MSTVEEIRNNRIEKLKKLKKTGAGYPLETKRTHEIKQAIADFDSLYQIRNRSYFGG
jgi:hypothetical protein